MIFGRRIGFWHDENAMILPSFLEQFNIVDSNKDWIVDILGVEGVMDEKLGG